MTFILIHLLKSQKTSLNMSAHTQLNSKADFDKAIQEQDKYVFIYCYENEPSKQAEE